MGCAPNETRIRFERTKRYLGFFNGSEMPEFEMPLDRCQEGRASQYAPEEGAGWEQDFARRKAYGHISMFEVRPKILGKGQCKRDMKRQSVKIRRQRRVA